MVSTKKSLAILSLLVVPSVGFTAPRSSQQSLKRARVGPLHSFEVMQSVGATDAPIMSTINSFFQTQPYLAAFLTCSFKASAADMIAQTQEMDKSSSNVESQPIDDMDSMNISRNLGFLFYGGVYQGIAQNFIFNTIYPSWFGTDDSMMLVAKEVLVDNLLFAPLLCLPVAYAFKAAFTSEEPLSINTLKTGMQKYKHDVMTNSLLLRYWSIWFPCNMITFGVIPPHYRVVFVAAISFFWICILSSIASSEDSATEGGSNSMQATPMDQ